MYKTDYSKIASKYDENKDRLRIKKDLLIESQLQENSEIRILDLGCGTGNYIQEQQKYYGVSPKIKWVAIDPSKEMLDIARAKCSNVEFINTTVEALPSFQERFHLITSHFSFHHFLDKHKALDIIMNNMESNGIFKYKNMVPEYMTDWWVYHYCPESFYEDKHRFWDLDLLVYELEKRGLSATQSISVSKAKHSLKKISDDFVRRDVSQLAMMEDRIYSIGLKKINNDMENGMTQYNNEFALGTIIAKTRST